MFDPTPEIPAATPPAETSARERMGILRRFSEIALRMAERLDRQSELAAGRAEGAGLPDALKDAFADRVQDSARSIAQLSRAAAVCLALEERIERGPAAHPPFGPELVVPVPRESRLKARRDEVHSAVRSAIDLHASATPVRVDDLCRRLDDVLDREVAAVDAFLTRPVEETIARLCTRLGIDPELALGDAPDPSPARGGMGPGRRRRLGGWGVRPASPRPAGAPSDPDSGPPSFSRASAHEPAGGTPPASVAPSSRCSATGPLLPLAGEGSKARAPP